MKKKVLIVTMIIVMLLGTISIDAATKVKTVDIRVGGTTRIETGLKSAGQIYSKTGKFKTVIVAYSQNFPDALAGGYLAKVNNAPIILTNDLNTGNTFNYIKAMAEPKAKVYLLGGKGVIGALLETKLKEAGFNTIRLGGSSRYETNLKILSATNAKGTELLVASGTGFADSLSGSSVGKPILLVGDTLTNEQKSFLRNGKFTKVYILGGTGAVSRSIEWELKSFAPVERLGGKNRAETSKLIANKFFPKADTVVLAYAHNFPDGLTGGALGCLLNAPVLLVTDANWSDAHNYVVSKRVTKSFTMGGTGVISDGTVKNVMTYYEGDKPSDPIIPTHTHTFEKGWSSDSTYHFHKATCTFDSSCKTQVKDKAKHSFKEVKVYQDQEVEITKTEVHTICNGCGEDFDIKFIELKNNGYTDEQCINYLYNEHFDSIKGWHSEVVEIPTGEYETIQVEAGRRYECAVCGYIKQD